MRKKLLLASLVSVSASAYQPINYTTNHTVQQMNQTAVMNASRSNIDALIEQERKEKFAKPLIFRRMVDVPELRNAYPFPSFQDLIDEAVHPRQQPVRVPTPVPFLKPEGETISV